MSGEAVEDFVPMGNLHLPATVHLVDDDPLILEMLRDMVSTIGVEAHTYSSGQAFLAAYRPLPCHCLVCDLRMPQLDGIALQARVSQLALAPPVIFLTGYGEVESAVQALKQGAYDYLEKRTFSGQTFLSKVQAALENSRQRYAKWLSCQTLAARMALLTPKERDILRLVVDGKSSREIAELLGVSVRTVEHHREHILQKLHIQSTVDLIKLSVVDSSPLV